jgi:hypothetical protein
MHLLFPHGPVLLLSFLLSLSTVHGQQGNALLHAIPPPPIAAQSGAQLGYSVAIDENYIVAGALSDDTGAHLSGVVKVFDSTTGTLRHVIPNPSPEEGDRFGSSVAISGTRVVVGAYTDDNGARDSGSAYVYDLSSSTPTVPLVTLNNPTPTPSDQFGYSVGISGTSIVVSAPFDDTGAVSSGSAYVYDLDSSTPSIPIATFNNPEPTANDYFGISVGISGSRVLVGAFFEDTGANGAGSAYVYDLNSSTNTIPVLTLHNPEPEALANFGYAVGISGTRVVISAYKDDTGATDAGIAYAYDLGSGTPTIPTTILNNPSPETADHFGMSVAISTTRVVVASSRDSFAGGNTQEVYVYDLASAKPGLPTATLSSTNPDLDDRFGHAVAISGTHVVVGADLDDTRASNAGSAYLFDVSSSTPSVVLFTMNDPTPTASRGFGESVAVFGNRLVIGAPQDDTVARAAGMAHIYDLSSSTPMVPMISLCHPNPGSGYYFGTSVAICGTLVVVGAHGDDTGATDAGSAFVYDLNSNTPFAPVHTLRKPNPARTDNFGYSVAIFGTRVVVGAYVDDTGATNSGSVYVYELSGGTPTVPIVTLNNPNPQVSAHFGYSLAISGSRLVVGARSEDEGATDSGRAYVFDFDSSTPTLPVVTLNNPSPGVEDYFGHSVNISDTRVVVGAYRDNAWLPDTGSAYVYDLKSSAPAVPVFTLSNPTADIGDQFGYSVAIQGQRVAVGANLDNAGAMDSGGAFVYNLSGFTPDRHVYTPRKTSPAVGDLFGSSVAVWGSKVIVGAPDDDTFMPNRGYVYVFGPTSDTVTDAPILFSPSAATTYGNPVSVSFCLPEAALPGSVKLSFGATQLTLAASQESAGLHSFSFDPANPTASPEIANGAVIADAVYTVTLSYQDALGNTTASDSHPSVRINAITVPIFTTLHAKDSPVPNAGVPSPGWPGGVIPAGAVWSRLGIPGINEAGQIAVYGEWRVGFNRGAGVFLRDADGADMRLVFRSGASVPGLTNLVIGSLQDPLLAEDGSVACLVTLANAPGTSTAVTADTSMALLLDPDGPGTAPAVVIARKGDAAPGASGETWSSFDSVALGNGAIAFLGRLNHDAEVNEANDLGLWVYDRQTATTRLALREGQSLLGSTLKNLSALMLRAAAVGQGRGVVSDGADRAFSCEVWRDNVTRAGHWR